MTACRVYLELRAGTIPSQRPLCPAMIPPAQHRLWCALSWTGSNPCNTNRYALRQQRVFVCARTRQAAPSHTHLPRVCRARVSRR